MIDDFEELEQRLARHAMPGPSEGLRRRIAALPGRAPQRYPWLSIAAAVLAVLSLAQIIALTPQVGAPRESPPPTAALEADIRQLDLPLTDEQAHQLADNRVAGARLHPLPEIHGKPSVDLSLGGMP